MGCIILSMSGHSLPGPDEIQALRAGQDADTQQIVIRYQDKIRQEIREAVQDHKYAMKFCFPDEVFHNVRIQLKDWVNEQPGYTANWSPAKNIEVHIPEPQKPKEPQKLRSKHPVAAWSVLIALLCGTLFAFCAVYSYVQSNEEARKERHEVKGFVTSYTYDYPTHNLTIYFSDDSTTEWTQFRQFRYDSGGRRMKPFIPTNRKLTIIFNGLREYVSFEDVSMPEPIPL